jgi:spore coat protein U-like protein
MSVRLCKIAVEDMRKPLVLITPLAMALCCMAQPAKAAISCTLSMTNVAFGSVNVLPGTSVNATATATITCSGAAASTSYVFCTSIVAGPDVSGTQRRMASGVNRLNFDLYKNSGRTTQWGDYPTSFLGGGSQNSFTSNTSGNISGTITVFASLAGSQQAAIPGAYSESMATNTLQYNAITGTCPVGTSTTTYSFTVTATVTTSCNISSTNLNFGSTGLLSANVNGSSTVTPQCTNGTPYNIGLNAGTGVGATVTTRKMTSGGGATINYSLYTDSGRTTVWGNTIGTNTVAGTGSGSSQGLTVFGRIPPQTTPAPATYSDSIIATVTY